EGTTFYHDFHEFSLEWEPDEMRFYVDGELFHTVNNWYTAVEGEDEVTYPAPFDQPFFVQMNLAVGGDWPGNPDGTTDFDRAEFAIDYVRVYQKESYDDTNVVKPSSVMHDPDETGNYVRNADFSVSENLEDEEDWKFLLAYSGAGAATIENNEMIITSTNAGTEDYSVQLVQPNMPIEKGGVYKVTFEAMAEEEREMKVAVTAPEVSWIRYLNDTSLTMGPEWQAYEFEFTMQNENDAKGRLEFNMGNQGSTATIHIRNVRLEKTGSVEVKVDDGEKTIQSDGNYVYNGTFQYGEGRLKYWQIENTTENAIIDVTNENLVRRLHAQVPEGTNDLQAVKVSQPGLALVGDTMYNLTFDAFGDKAQTIEVSVGSQTFEAVLTEEYSNYSFPFSLGEGEEKPTLTFALGTEGNVYIDNVKIKEDGALINASFSNGLVGWEPFADSTVADSVSYAVDSLSEDDAAGFTIDTTGDQNWHIQLMQKNISLYKGKKYKLSFDAKCSVDRSIELAAQRNGSQDDIWTEYGKASFDLTSEYQTYTLEFEMTEENNLSAMITFSMGAINGEVITDSHVIFIDNVVLQEQ
ncbi:MAG: carbohydrate binding domain-containing protein, partial [Firmicutes bacterium]|nr:carbohydrate binding domain-containing protein [Bacillota bacterium]